MDPKDTDADVYRKTCASNWRVEGMTKEHENGDGCESDLGWMMKLVLVAVVLFALAAVVVKLEGTH